MSSLQGKINFALEAEQEKRKDRVRSGKFNPSNFGRCFRLQIYDRRNTPKSNPPDILALRKFYVGYIFHKFVQSFLPSYQCEVKIEDEDVCGYADIVSDNVVHDVKSQHSRAFWYMQKTSYDVNKEKFTNILQVMTYVHYLNKKEGHLVFVSKDDLCIAEYSFSIERWRPEVLKEIGMLKKWWQSGALPPKEPRAYNGKDCNYCSWKDHCGGAKK